MREISLVLKQDPKVCLRSSGESARRRWSAGAALRLQPALFRPYGPALFAREGELPSPVDPVEMPMVWSCRTAGITSQPTVSTGLRAPVTRTHRVDRNYSVRRAEDVLRKRGRLRSPKRDHHAPLARGVWSVLYGGKRTGPSRPQTCYWTAHFPHLGAKRCTFAGRRLETSKLRHGLIGRRLEFRLGKRRGGCFEKSRSPRLF